MASGGTTKALVPHPLQPGDAPRMKGAIVLDTPDFSGKVIDKINVDFLQKVQKVVLQSATVSPRSNGERQILTVSSRVPIHTKYRRAPSSIFTNAPRPISERWESVTELKTTRKPARDKPGII